MKFPKLSTTSFPRVEILEWKLYWSISFSAEGNCSQVLECALGQNSLHLTNGAGQKEPFDFCPISPPP